jgi:hypothetical protein
VRLSAAAVTVTPSRGLRDGQLVTVDVRGLEPGIKFFLSECLTPTDANPAGCGSQLAAQPFGLTNSSGSGSTTFTVHSAAADGSNVEALTPCAGECVIEAKADVAGHFFLIAPLGFASG